MKPAVIKRLRDALQACNHIATFTRAQTLDDYLADVMLRSAVERQIAVVGEALHQARHLDPSLADQVPRLHQSIAMRHRIIHGDTEIDDELVWMTSQIRIPQLRDQLARLLHDAPPGDTTTAS